jgi:ribosomal protein S27E
MSALTKCPKCGHGSIESTGESEFDDCYAWAKIECLDCGTTWDEVYKHSEQDIGA